VDTSDAEERAGQRAEEVRFSHRAKLAPAPLKPSAKGRAVWVGRLAAPDRGRDAAKQGVAFGGDYPLTPGGSFRIVTR
jgi:hypothetical protein